MKVCTVVAELRGVVAWGADPIHFDGVLGRADAVRHPGRSHPSRSRPMADMSEQHLPLLKVHAAGAWCWLATAGEFVGPEPQPAPIFATKRRDVEDWDRLAAPVNVTAGPGKDYMIRNPGRVGQAIRFLAAGSRNQIRKDLKLLWGPEDKGGGFVGALSRFGAGQITAWQIEESDDVPLASLLVHHGRAVRHLPASWVEPGATTRRGSHAPPYWHPDRQGLVVPVGAACELRVEVLRALVAADRAR